MKLRKRHFIIAAGSALVFSSLYFFAAYRGLEWRLYDFFLGLRPERPRIENLLLLDVDDPAINHVGVWPWPRSVMADGLVRLKEFGAAASVFDIEFIDSSPPGIDSDYLQRGLARDFQRSFGEIAANSSDLVSAVISGQLGASDAREYAGELERFINESAESLLGRTKTLARDNDVYLGKAMALYGSSWATMNLQKAPLEGEQAGRRELWRVFAAPLAEGPGASEGPLPPTDPWLDILAPIAPVAKAARGAGFVNVVIDSDGVRRRIELARKIDDQWYLQLILAPLYDKLGKPRLSMDSRGLHMRGAAMPDGSKADIDIPLDKNGYMLIDWPRQNYFEDKPFKHLSFYALSSLEEQDRLLDDAMLSLAASKLWFVSDEYPSLGRAAALLAGAAANVEKAAAFRAQALDECSDQAFAAWVAARKELRAAASDFLAGGAVADLGKAAGAAAERLRLKAKAPAAQAASQAAAIEAEADHVARTSTALGSIYARLESSRAELAAILPGKTCIIGWVGSSTTDIGVNPFHSEYINVGTHAAVADTILSRSFMRASEPWLSALIAIILTPLLILLGSGLKPGLRAGVGLASALMLLFLSYLILAFGKLYVGPLSPVLAMIAAVAVREVVDLVSAERDKSFLRKAFSTYLADSVVDTIVADPSSLKLGGSEKPMTALFTDIKGFSSLSEKLAPEELVSLLNVYLSGMSDIVLDQGGTIDKYIGDAIVSFFGAPLPLPDHAARACKTAILMKRAERSMNERFLADGKSPMPIATRIGINTGPMVVGNMGTERKMNYTIMGNAVNLAARLEGVNKQYGSWILVSESAIRECGNAFAARRLDRVRVVGIDEPVRLYELVELRADLSPEREKLLAVFDEGLGLFERRDWKAARAAFAQALALNPEDGPSTIYLERSEKFMKTPPLSDWDGVFNLKEK